MGEVFAGQMKGGEEYDISAGGVEVVREKLLVSLESSFGKEFKDGYEAEVEEQEEFE